MKHTVNDLLSIRDAILKNSTLNALLAASLTNTSDPVKVYTSLQRLKGKTRWLMKEQKGERAKLPGHVKVDIVTCLNEPIKIGYSYLDYPLVWEKILP